MSDYNSIIKLTEEGFELKETFTEAKENEKISPLEWFKIVREASDVIKAAKELEADDIENISNEEIETLSVLVMNSIKREVKFVREDLVNVLKIARNLTQMIERER